MLYNVTGETSLWFYSCLLLVVRVTLDFSGATFSLLVVRHNWTVFYYCCSFLAAVLC